MNVTSSSLVIGRDAELARLESGLRLVPCAVILGLPGVGKSALARRFAAQWPRPAWVQHARDGAELWGLIDDLRRQLGAGARRALASDEERFAELAERLDEGGHLWLLEDADRVAGAGAMLSALAARLGRGRVIATARGRLFAAERGPERVEIVLDGLDAVAARRLWHHLDELYGAAAGFEAAWQRSGGNPFLLRQAHAGVVDAEDPAAAAIAQLAAAPRQLALAMALTAEPLHRDVLAQLGPGEPADALAALAALLACLIVEPAGGGRFAVHDLLRGALLGAAPPVELRRAHARLAAALEAAPADAQLDEVARVRERARHLLGAGQRAEARALVLGNAQLLVRAGAAAELLRCLDAVGDDGDAELQLARARTLIRMLELRRAYDLLIALGADGRDASDELRVALVHVAMLTGRLELAARVSRSAQAQRRLLPALRMRLVTADVITRTFMGEGDRSRRHTEELLHTLGGRGAAEVLRAYLLFTRAFSLWLEERDAEAEAEMRAAWALCKDVLSFRARVMAPLFFSSVLARTGNRAESQRVLSEVESDVADFEDPLVEVSQRMIRVTLLECEGAFDEALRLVAEVEATYQQAGMALASLWARLARGRLLLRTGRVRAGRARLEELARGAAELGAHAVVRLAEETLRADPLAAALGEAGGGSGWPEAARRAAGRPGAQHRGKALAALAALGEGQLEVARGYAVALESGEPAPGLARGLGMDPAAERTAERTADRTADRASGSAFDRTADRVFEPTFDPAADPLTAALLTLVRAALAQPREREVLLAEALAQAAAAGADPELLPALAARAMPGAEAMAVVEPAPARASTRTPGASGASGASGAAPAGGMTVVIDTVNHELRCDERVVALARRPSVRRLLYTLAAEPGRVCDKEALTRGIWNTAYHPTRHDGALWVNVKRLREVLDGTGLRVDSSDEGYRLRVDDGHVLRTS